MSMRKVARKECRGFHNRPLLETIHGKDGAVREIATPSEAALAWVNGDLDCCRMLIKQNGSKRRGDDRHDSQGQRLRGSE